MDSTNWLDRMIYYFSPERGAQRLAARATYQELGIAMRGRRYDAAKKGRRQDGWFAPSSSSNAENGPALSILRARSHDLVRNNPYAARAISTLAANIIGKGILPRPVVRENDSLKRKVREDWDAFNESCDPAGLMDFNGMQELVARTVAESGEALIQVLPRPTSFKLRVPLQLQVLEPDIIDVGRSEELKNGNVIIQGVEFDRFGRRVAYWMFDGHPGETVPFLRRSFDSRRISADNIYPVFDVWRPGQVHGVPWLTPAAMKLRDLGDYDEAELVRKKIESCFSVFVRKPGDARVPLTADADTESSGRRIERVSPGMINYLEADEDISFANPTQNGSSFSDYMYVQLHAIAVGVGVTYEQITGDLSQVNFSSIRAGLQEFWKLLDQWQCQMMIHQMCKPVWRRVNQTMFALGQRPDIDIPAIWSPPIRPWVDPLKDIKAKKEEIRSGITTLPQAIAERGRDPDDQLDEIEQTNSTLDDKEVILDSDPRWNVQTDRGENDAQGETENA